MSASFIDKYRDGDFNMLLWCLGCKNRCVFTPPPFWDIGNDYMICSECGSRGSWTAPAMERAKQSESPFGTPNGTSVAGHSMKAQDVGSKPESEPPAGCL